MPVVKKKVELDEEDVSWFTDTYGSGASLSWALGMLLGEFRKAHEKTPQELGAIGAAELKRMLEER